MKMQESEDCGSDASALNQSLYYPWICLVSIMIGGLFSTIVIIILYSSRNISGAIFNEYVGPQSQLTDAVSSDQFRTALLISVSFAIPMFFDSILDCAYPITYQEERVLWYSKVLFMITATIPNFILLTSNFGTLTEDLYIIFFYLYRTSVVGFTMAYTSQIALKYGMNDISRVCVLIVILGTSAYCLKSISNFAMTPVVSFLTNSASALLVISHFLVYRGVHQWYVTAHSAGESVSYCEIVILVKLLSAITCNLLFTVAAFYHSAFDFRNSSSSCICTYLYIQMLFIIIVMTIPGRISRLEVNCATRAMKDRQAFIRYISHEIRTPLNTVFLGLEFVTSALKRIPSRIGDDSIRPVMDTVEDICSSCEIAMSILNDLLTFDKLDGGKMALELDYVNCCNFIYSLSKPFNVNARDKNIAFHVNFMNLSPDFIENAHIRVDSSKMGQVVRNLISNALKFTPDHGTVTLMLSHLKIDNFGDCVNFQTEVKEPMLLLPEEKNHGLRDVLRLEVSDTGAGISAANQTKLFGEYVQFNANKLQQGNGSGLGLWISKGITELHGGCIGAHSEGEGKGSTFHLELPVTFLAKEGKSRTVSASVSSHSTPAGAYMLGDSSGICSRTTAPGSDLDGDIGEDIFMDRIGLKEPTTESLTAGVMSHLRRLHSINHSAVLRSLQHQSISRNEAKEWKHRSGGDPGDADSVEVEGDEFNMDMNSEYDADEMDRSEEDKIGAMQKMMGVYSGSSSVSSKSSISRDRSAAYGMSDSSSLAATGSGTNTGAGNVSDPSLLSRKSSADLLSTVHPLITTSIPFTQSMNCSRNSMSISSSRFQSRYPSVSNTPRCTTPPHASSGISTPSLTGHNTPHYSSQRVSPAGSAILQEQYLRAFSFRSLSRFDNFEPVSEMDQRIQNFRMNNFSLRPESHNEGDRTMRSKGGKRSSTSSYPNCQWDKDWPSGRLNTDRSTSTSFSAASQSNKNEFNDAQSWIDSPKNSPCSRIEPLHFLIVDDVLLNRRMVHRLLSTYDFQISEAQDGKDCMSVLEGVESGGGKIDVVLMDNCMPVMTGPQAASALRAKGFKGVIIGVTGHAQSKDIEEFKRCGADAVLAKPLKFEALKDLVRDLLGREERTL